MADENVMLSGEVADTAAVVEPAVESETAEVIKTDAASPEAALVRTPPERAVAALDHVKRVIKGAAETSRRFPSFNLDEEMADPVFVRLTVALDGDTTAAYVARHYEDIVRDASDMGERRGAQRLAASVRQGSARPSELSLESRGGVIMKRDVSSFSLADFKSIRETFRKTGKREKF